jgi:uncharacterized membrane protein
MILVALMFFFVLGTCSNWRNCQVLLGLISASFVVIAILITQFHLRFSSNIYPHQFFKHALLGAAAFLFGIF